MRGAVSEPWVVFKYEVNMFKATLDLCERGRCKSFAWSVRNAVVESLLLHTRILVEILLSRDRAGDNIRLSALVPGFASPKIEQLKNAYGTRKEVESPCWTLNKMLAHPSSIRSGHYDYSTVIDKLKPIMTSIMAEIENFPSAVRRPSD